MTWLLRTEAAATVDPAVDVIETLGDLHRAGLVDVRRGAGAGWSLAREPDKITLLDVYQAVEPEPLFAMHRTEPNLECPVGRGIRPALGQVYSEVDRALRRELARTSIADVLQSTLRVR
jgi:DNA-binding IscR family transcriptional regulator